jgi:Mg2+-importing ATPase
MTFRGFLVFYDPPKADAQRTIRDLNRLGIRIKVISGDNRYVTAHLAEAVGLDAKSILTGKELATLKDEALWHLAPRTDLFVEIDPQQKERIVRALQRTGHSVGYLGDGINDAPALHTADVGISVEEAVDVARESADIILLSRDLDVLRSGVEDGRRTFANTLKYISITTSANFGNMVSMALATPLLPFLPLAAKQILLNSLRRAVDRDLERQCRSGPGRTPAALEYQGHPAVHGRLRTDQLRLRSADLRRPAAGVPCRRGDLPDLMVHDFASD